MNGEMQNTNDMNSTSSSSSFPFHIFSLLNTSSHSLSCPYNESNIIESSIGNHWKHENMDQNVNNDIVSNIPPFLSVSGNEKHSPSLNVLNKDQWFMLWAIFNMKNQVSVNSSTCQLSTKQQQEHHSETNTSRIDASLTTNAPENSQFVENNLCSVAQTWQSMKIPSSDCSSLKRTSTASSFPNASPNHTLHNTPLVVLPSSSMNDLYQSSTSSPFLSDVNEFILSSEKTDQKHRKDDDTTISPLLNEHNPSNCLKKPMTQQPQQQRHEIPTLEDKDIQKKSSCRQKKLSSKPYLVPTSFMSEFLVRDEQQDHAPIFIQHTEEMLKQELMIKKGLLPKRPRGRPRKNHNNENDSMTRNTTTSNASSQHVQLQ